ncbi:type IV pilus secretin PilQ [Limnohabitans sp. Rim11]|uniref:type IV pilus secretin PilQ n=1 Tax=Limnohabitans sp. Rim11 TaxID=1100719 RepID=UPI000AD4C289|nr:type IV pilus secretin PilQ [Limnohabitans sp. Rim11]
MRSAALFFKRFVLLCLSFACMVSALASSEAKLKWNFQNIEIKALLQSLAEIGQHNLIVADGVVGQVSLHLRDMTWREALQVVVSSKGLVMTDKAGVLWISSPALTAENLQTLAVPLKYAKALDIAQRLQAASAGGAGGGGAAGAVSHRWMSAKGTVMAEPRTNQLFFLDTPAYLKQLQAVIQQLDVPVRQVLIEAKIVEAEEQFGKSLGTRLGGAYAASFAPPFSSSGRPVNVALGAQGLPTTGGVQPGYMVNLPAGPAGQALYAPPTFAVSLFNAGANQFLNLEISAMEADGKGRVVASPRVITADQTKALIEQGTELPYQVSNGNGAASISFRKANLKLEVTPQITPEGAVVLELDIAKDSVGQITTAGYAINTKHVKTQVLVDNGGTVVIGGILEAADKDDVAKVPGLGQLPGLGWLFKSQQLTQRKTEMLIFVTPRVLADAVPSAASNTLGGSTFP